MLASISVSERTLAAAVYFRDNLRSYSHAARSRWI